MNWHHCLVTAALCAAVCFPTRAATNVAPGIAAAYLVRIDGATVWADGVERRLPPASLTKLMTALLTVQDFKPDAVATVSHHAAAASGSRLGLKAGERVRVGDLLAATLIASANDACRALAEWNAGSEDAFVAMMNRKAADLGLANTRFVNACGYDAKGHYSTASDLARLADEAMRSAPIAEAVARIDVNLTDAEGRREFRTHNRNALIGRYPGAVGVKSGFTARAGTCVIVLAERAGVRVLLVMLGGKNRWWDAHALLDRAFDHAAAHAK
ncbi:MAG: D-alanyl-D-alanine carboxypeptidase family protein [Burkholderiales bacterium]